MTSYDTIICPHHVCLRFIPDFRDPVMPGEGKFAGVFSITRIIAGTCLHSPVRGIGNRFQYRLTDPARPAGFKNWLAVRT
jgi:hypothetical protein